MIGVFDSGYGGLSIFKDIEKRLPQYDYIYLGDNARAPYGDRSQKIIYRYVQQAVDYLFAQGCDLIILACNTASSMALRKIQQEYLPAKYPGKNVLGVIRPLVEAASELERKNIVAVMGTISTIESEAYPREFAEVDRSIKVVGQACPLLVPLIENSRENFPETQIILTEYTRPLKKINPDVLILGCTHYGHLYSQIRKSFPPETQILDSGKIVAEKLAQYIEKHSQYDKPSAQPLRKFLTTNSSEKFDAAAEKFLGRQIKSQSVNLK